MVSLRGLWVIQMETPRITVDVWHLFEHPESGGHEKYTSALTEGWGQPRAEELCLFIQKQTYSDSADLPKLEVTYVPFGTW